MLRWSHFHTPTHLVGTNPVSTPTDAKMRYGLGYDKA